MNATMRTTMWLWIAVLIAAPLVAVLTFGLQTGICIDVAAEGTHLQSSCTTGPYVGWPGAILVAVVCAVLFGLAVVRLAQRSRRRVVSR